MQVQHHLCRRGAVHTVSQPFGRVRKRRSHGQTRKGAVHTVSEPRRGGAVLRVNEGQGTVDMRLTCLAVEWGMRGAE
eukprot:scaffold5319_cov109-Isochrysis_galbana.AAC.1